MRSKVLEVVNLSEMNPEWNWLAGKVRAQPPLHWASVTTKTTRLPMLAPKVEASRRWFASLEATALTRSASSMLVSHGPHMTLYGSAALRARIRRRHHLAYAFNFTALPTGARHKAMSLAFRSVDRFVCFSTMERDVYAQHFGLDISRIDMIHWAVRPPEVDMTAPPEVSGDYICALGSQGRDYGTLLAAMTRLPSVKLVLVATAEALGDATIPPNVEVRCGIPLSQAMNVLAHSRFNVVPLSGSRVPCGHVTIVAGMHLGKATIVTDSLGVADYVRPALNGVTVEPDDPAAMARAIEALWADSSMTSRLSANAMRFASVHCCEPVVVRYFEDYLETVRSQDPT